MSKSTTLASGQITPTDTISVELVQPDSMPATVKITWPLQPTVADPRRFPDVAATVASLFATAATALAGIKSTRPEMTPACVLLRANAAIRREPERIGRQPPSVVLDCGAMNSIN